MDSRLFMKAPIKYRWQLTGTLNKELLLRDKWEHDNLKLEPCQIDNYAGIKITFNHANHDESRQRAREEAVAKIEDFLKTWSFNRGYRIKLTVEKLDLVNEDEVSIQRGYKTGASYILGNVRPVDQTDSDILNEILQLNETIRKNPNKYSLEKCRDWYVGSLEHQDPSDKFLSIWIAFNIMYNLYNALIDREHKDEYYDEKKAIGIQKLLHSESIMKQIINLPELIKFLNQYNISKTSKKETIRYNVNLQKAYEGGNHKEAFENLLKCLYKIRCSLFHGVKARDDERQKKLLTRCYGVLQLLVKEAFFAYIRLTERRRE